MAKANKPDVKPKKTGAARAKPAKGKPAAKRAGPRPEDLPDEALLELVQRQTFGFFWDAAHPVSGLARDRDPDPRPARSRRELIGIGGSGFGVMAIIVAVERGWVTREEALARLRAMLDVLIPARNYHGIYPHFMNGRTGATIPFSRKDDGGDLVETSLSVHGSPLRAAIFRPRRRRRAATAPGHHQSLGRSRVELVHPGRAQAPLLALEP